MAAVAAAAILAAAAAAWPARSGAYVLRGEPWAGGTISFRSDLPEGTDGRLRRAVATWQAAAAVTFVEADEGDPDPDLVVIPGGPRCMGYAMIGSGEGQWMRLGACDGPLATLVAVHELGHVLGLGHEHRRCAMMNPVLSWEGTPKRCSRRGIGFWSANPLRADDVLGARALYGG